MLNLYSKTVVIIFLTGCAFLFFSCRTPGSSLRSFSGETLAFKWTDILDDSISIIRNNNTTIYRLPSYHSVSTANLNKEGGVISEELKTTLVFSYFLHKEKEISGLMYDSVNAGTYSEKLLVDSVLSKHAFKGGFNCLDNNKKKIAVVEEGDYSIETYIPAINVSSSYDTTYLHFSKKLKDLKYSFSPELDRDRNSKLFRIKHVRNPVISPEGKTLVPRIEYSFDLKRMKVENKNPLQSLIDRFSKIEVQ